MGLWDWFNAEAEDTSLVQISNDIGDHIVAEVPTNAVDSIEIALGEAGLSPDNDESYTNLYSAERKYEQRDHEEMRYTSAPVVNEDEDLEAEIDDDTTLDCDRDVDKEPEATEDDEQKATGGWSWW